MEVFRAGERRGRGYPEGREGIDKRTRCQARYGIESRGNWLGGKVSFFKDLTA